MPTYTHPSHPNAVGTILPVHEADQITGRVIGDFRRAEGYVLVSWNTGSNIKPASWVKPEELTPIENPWKFYGDEEAESNIEDLL